MGSVFSSYQLYPLAAINRNTEQRGHSFPGLQERIQWKRCMKDFLQNDGSEALQLPLGDHCHILLISCLGSLCASSDTMANGEMLKVGVMVRSQWGYTHCLFPVVFSIVLAGVEPKMVNW